MKTWVRKSLNVGVLSAGFLLVSGGAAHADWTTGYNAGLLDGNQLDTKLQVPVDVSGNALGLLGFANAQSGGGAVANTESASTESANSTESWTSGFNGGILNGNQLSNTLQLPINVCGNSIAVLGFADASCGGGAVANTGGMHAHRHGGESTTIERRHHHNGNGGANAAGANGWGGAHANSNGGGDWTTGYNAGVLNGNQASTTIQVPIDLCGNAIAVAGFSSASCSGGAWANAESASTESARTEDRTTGFNAGVANGNQISTVLQAPINVCGNSVAVLGFSSASCGGGAVANTGGMGNGNGMGNGHHHHHHHRGGNGDGNGMGNGSDNYGGGAGNGSDNYGGGAGNGNSAYDNSAGATGVATHKAHQAHKAKATKHAKMTATSAVGEAADEHGDWNDPSGSGNGNDGYGGTGNSNGGYDATGGANGYGNSNGNGGANGGYDGTGGDNGNGNGNGNGGNGGNGGWHHGGGSQANAGSCGDWTTGYNAGLLNGNQLSTTLQVPVNVSGNAIGILGFANASSQGGAVANAC